MKRLLYKSLISWKENINRKPLILNGARQVGKTYLLTEFAKNEYKNLAYFSLDRLTEVRDVFNKGGKIEKIIRSLSALSGIDIMPHNTLIILDEIQDCPKALESLKYFCEDAPDYHIAVAGSLLELSLHEGISFPVGKVNTLRLLPMNFEEFLLALNKDKIVEELNHGDWDLINSLSEELIDLLRQYYYVGGMPSVVLAYIKNLGLKEVRKRQKDILEDYSRDFSKHAPSNQVPRIQMVWNSIPSQLARENKKFVYGAMKKGARANDFELAIQWLIDAGLIYKINRVNSVKMPLKFYEDLSAFKLFLLDVGLMGAMVDAPASSVLVNNKIFVEYKGAFTELFVCCQLINTNIPCFYHSSNNSTIEFDFVVQLSNNVYPVEVKAEENVHSKSLKTFIDKNSDLTGIRLSMKNYINQEWVESIPLYAFIEEFNRRL
ncbi:MAG: ATP-binding protein [Bacteroidales bacterium]|nr:ATP-binding protein [Bacteroidales bacterium]